MGTRVPSWIIRVPEYRVPESSGVGHGPTYQLPEDLGTRIFGYSNFRVPNLNTPTEDCQGVIYLHEDPLVIVMGIANHNVWQSLVDGGIGANILFRGAFDQLRLEAKYLTSVPYPVFEFNGSSSYLEDGKILILVTIDKGWATRNTMAEFLVVDVPSAYNMIVGRPLIHDIQWVVSTYHQTMIYVSREGHSEKIKGS